MYSRKLLTQNLDYTETLNMFDSEINLEIANEAEAISVAYESMKQILPNEVIFKKLMNSFMSTIKE